MSPKFNKSAETLEQRKAHLQKYGKELDESLRQHPKNLLTLKPDGSIKRDVDKIAEREVRKVRIDIAKEVESINQQLREQKAQEQRFRQRQEQRQRQKW